MNRTLNYRSLFADSDCIENNLDMHSAMGLMLADQAPSETPDPLEQLLRLEERLMEEHGTTFLQAVKAGIVTRTRPVLHLPKAH